MTRAQALDSARQLVTAGASYEEAAQKTGLPVSTLQKRGAEEGWMKARATSASYLTSSMSYKHELLDLSRTMFKGAADDATKITAAIQLHQQWLAMEKAFPEYRYTPTEADPKARLATAVEVLGELVEYLGTKDRNANTALTPHITAFTAWLADRYGA